MVASVKRLRKAATTVEYFEKDGYYTRGAAEHSDASRWYGEGARACGLHDRRVAEDVFEAVLGGYVQQAGVQPRDGLRLGRLRGGEVQHMPGLDVTFSAPKSFSLEALLYAPNHTRARLINAHDAAVRAALDFLERELLQTRGYDPVTRRRPRVSADGLVAATFRHTTNRNLDPQLHTHAVIANMTRNAAGDWRSAEFTRVSRAMKLLGAYYRAELQRRVEAIGYETVRTMVGPVPGFEIAGYPRALLAHFSSRRRDLLAWLEARGIEYTPATAQQATLATRRRVEAPDRDRLAGIWEDRSERCKGDCKSPAVRRGRRAPPTPPSPLEMVYRAVDHLAERSTLFTAHDLRGYALAYGGGGQELPDIDDAIVKLQQSRLLLPAWEDAGNLAEVDVDRMYTTRRAKRAEREVLRRMRDGRDAGRPLADRERVAAALAEGSLNEGQRTAVETALLAPHRVVGVQGYAGTGKTTMLREVARLAAGTGTRLFGLAPSTAATRVLEREAGIQTRTLQWFLTRHGDIADGEADETRLADARAVHGDGLLIVDEASMIGTTAMVRLLRIADRVGVARVLLVGDRAQLRAVAAGQPFRLLQRAGMPTARMSEVLRQQDLSLRTAVEHLIAERPGLAIEELGDRVIEVGGSGDPEAEMAETMAILHLSLGADARERTLLLAPTHALRAEVHDRIRRGLADEGALRGPSIMIERYVNQHLTLAQKRELLHYRAGDVVVFHQNSAFRHDGRQTPVEAGSDWRVVGAEGGSVLLDRPGEPVRPMGLGGRVPDRFDLYEIRDMELRVGDRIRWTRSHRADGLELDNGTRATVRAIDGETVHFEAPDGASYALARGHPQIHHIDYAYTSTVHGAQGLTADSVIAILPADPGPLTDLTTAYVELSRARDNAILLTDDREALGAALDQQSPEECSALEALGIDLPDYGRARVPAAAAAAPIAERHRIPAEAVAWEEFAEAARAQGELPFAAAGAEAAMAPLLALPAEMQGALPAGIDRVVSDYEAWCRQRARETPAARQRLSAARQRLEEAVERKLYVKSTRVPRANHRLLTLARRLRNALLRLLVVRRRAVTKIRRGGPGGPADAYEEMARGHGELEQRLRRRLERVLRHLGRLQLRAREGPSRLPIEFVTVHRQTRKAARWFRNAVGFDRRALAAVSRLRRDGQADGDRPAPRDGGHAETLPAEIETPAAAARSPVLAPLVVLPPELVQARLEHRRDARRRTVVRRVLTRAADVLETHDRIREATRRDGVPLGSHPEYPAWHREAGGVLPLARKILGTEARYRPHVEAAWNDSPSGRRPDAETADTGWGGFERAVGRLRDVLARDGRARGLETEAGRLRRAWTQLLGDERDALHGRLVRRHGRVIAVHRDDPGAEVAYKTMADDDIELEPQLPPPLDEEERSRLPAEFASIQAEIDSHKRTFKAVVDFDVRAREVDARRLAAGQQADGDRPAPRDGGHAEAWIAEAEVLANVAESDFLKPLVVLPPGLVLPPEVVRARQEDLHNRRRRETAEREQPPVAKVLGERRRILEALGEGDWFQSHPEHDAWRREADRIFAVARKALDAEARRHPTDEATRDDPQSDPPAGRRPDTDTADTGWDAFEWDVEDLRRARDRDDRARVLLATWTSRFERDAGLPHGALLYDKEYLGFIEELRELDTREETLPGELPAKLIAVLEEHDRQAELQREVVDFVERELPVLKGLPARRRELPRGPSEAHPTVFDHPTHQAWVEDARTRREAAQRLLDGQAYAPHLRAIRAARRRIRKAHGAVGKLLEADLETTAVLHDWRDLAARARQWRPHGHPEREPAPGRAAFFEDGCDALIKRIKAVHRKTRRHERLPEFEAAIEEHEQLAAIQREVDEPLVTVRTCTAKRRKLLERTASRRHPFLTAHPRRHAEWKRLGAEAAAAGRKLARMETYRPHLLHEPHGWADILHSAFEVVASEGLGGLDASHLLRLHDHGADCERRGKDSWTADGLDDIVAAIKESVAPEADPAPDRSAGVEQEPIRQAVAWLEYKRAVRKVSGRIAELEDERRHLEDLAARRQCAVFDLPAHRKWVENARAVCDLARKLAEGPRYEKICKFWPEPGRLLSEGSTRLERRRRNDWNAELERLGELAEQQRKEQEKQRRLKQANLRQQPEQRPQRADQEAKRDAPDPDPPVPPDGEENPNEGSPLGGRGL